MGKSGCITYTINSFSSIRTVYTMTWIYIQLFFQETKFVTLCINCLRFFFFFWRIKNKQWKYIQFLFQERKKSPIAQNGYLSHVTQQVKGLKGTGSKPQKPRGPKVVKSLFHSKQQSVCGNCSKSFGKNKAAVG